MDIATPRLLAKERRESISVAKAKPLKIEQWAIGRVHPYAKNARLHSDEQIAAIAASIKEFGFVNPALVDAKGVLVAGHGRILAANSLKMKTVPVIRLGHLTPAQAKAYRLADNRLMEKGATWDDDLLRVELVDLEALGFDLDLTGFDLADYADTEEASGQDDALPKSHARTISRRGDVWHLGDHRLMCGDSTDASDIATLAADRLAALIFTSPPYDQQRKYINGIGDWQSLMCGVFAGAPAAQDCQILVNLGLVHRDGEWVPYWDGWIAWMREQGWRRFGWYVWDQGFGLPGDWNGRLAPSHEFLFHFNRVAERARKTKFKKTENIKARARGASTMRHADGLTREFTSPEASAQRRKVPDSVVRINRQVGRVGQGLDHPAVFPVEFAKEVIGAFSDVGDLLFEPFSGAGTTIIAAERSEREAVAMEIEPQYVDLTVRRWDLLFPDRPALLEGETLAQVARRKKRTPIARRPLAPATA